MHMQYDTRRKWDDDDDDDDDELLLSFSKHTQTCRHNQPTKEVRKNT